MCVYVCIWEVLWYSRQSTRVYVCACVFNQYLWCWIYSGTFPGALQSLKWKFPLIIVYFYTWINKKKQPFHTDFKLRRALKKEKTNLVYATQNKYLYVLCPNLMYVPTLQIVSSIWLMSSLANLSALEYLFPFTGESVWKCFFIRLKDNA